MGLFHVMTEIEIWLSTYLMLRRYGDTAQDESNRRADEFAAAGDPEGEAGCAGSSTRSANWQTGRLLGSCIEVPPPRGGPSHLVPAPCCIQAPSAC
jgi:hypothetical protein